MAEIDHTVEVGTHVAKGRVWLTQAEALDRERVALVEHGASEQHTRLTSAIPAGIGHLGASRQRRGAAGKIAPKST